MSACVCVYRDRIKGYVVRIIVGFINWVIPLIETTRENGFGITMYLCCVIVKRTCQYYGVDRSRHTMTLFFYSRTIGCQGDFLF